MNNKMTLKIKALSENESFSRSTVAAFCAVLNPTVDEIGDIKTALSEAVTNSIVHGYRHGDGDITIETEIINNDCIHISVIDEGVGIEDIEQARQPFFSTRPDEDRSGMGFTIMESFMDKLEILPNHPHGLIVKMEKRLNNAKSED